MIETSPVRHPHVFPKGPFRGLNTRATTAATGLVGLWVMLGTWRPDLVAEALSDVRSATGPTLGWYYVLLVTVILVIVLWLGLGRYRNVRLGKDNERPEFGMVSWMAMLFAAGTGVGLLFWSIAEPISHFQGNPFSDNPGTPEAAVDAARLTLFHWGLHGWAIFALMGAMLAYFSYRGNLPLTTRSALYPLIGERIYGWRGDLVDTFAVVSTVFGITTTLGLGAAQMNAGLHWLVGIDISVGRQLTIILFVTSLAIFSVVSGVRRGVRWLSIGNMWLGVGLLMFFLIIGPTSWLLRFIIQSAGSYGQHLIEMSFWTNVTGTSGWQQSWTVFYWGWWLSWTPFVGMFIARISRGRTLREFVFAVLLVPTLFSLIWIGGLGGTALHNELYGLGGIADAVTRDVTLALYETIDVIATPGLSTVAAIIATVLIATFFVTSADSGILVIVTILALGESDPPITPRIFWGVGIGALTAVLLAGGGVTTLQSAVVIAGLPFSFVVLAMAIGFLKALRSEPQAPRDPEKIRLPTEPWTGIDTKQEGEHSAG